MNETKPPMRFEDLEAWQSAREMTRKIYSVTRNRDITRDFGLCDQVQRAGVSTMSNTAEGFERQHLQEKLQFYNVAHSSTAEVRSLTYVLEDNYPKHMNEAMAIRETASQCGRLLTGLIRSTEARKRKNRIFLSLFLCSASALLIAGLSFLPSALFHLQ
jgi:four helix bundle protein